MKCLIASGMNHAFLSSYAYPFAGCLLVLAFAGCAASGETASNNSADEYAGSLRSYSYDISIWWEGERCQRREIVMERRCGTCRGEVTRARFYDFDCDGIAEQYEARGEHQNFAVNTVSLEEEAWHAFYLFVPPSQTGDSRTVVLNDRR